ncbi:hypothetical protein H6G93_09235 [Nostoc sp. FACHB-973]|nr:hypothetical protein [Nostoc sp. FACHB-973]
MNESLITLLPSAQKVTGIFAYLTDELNSSVYQFLFNPEEKQFSREARYEEGATAVSSLPSQQYKYTTGRTLRLNNLLLETHARGKSCQPLIQQIEDLMVADPVNGKYAPSIVTFKWGSNSFGGAVITSLDWREQGWLNGELASAILSFTLLEVPTKEVATTPVGSSNANSLLTARQQEDASSKGSIWLKDSVKKLKESVYDLVRSNKYKMSTSREGLITILNSKNKLVGQVGTYKNGKLDTSTTNLLK